MANVPAVEQMSVKLSNLLTDITCKCAETLCSNDKILGSHGKMMDNAAAKKFLSKGRIHYKDLVSRKTGRQYEATVEMVDPGEGNVQFNLIFPQR